MTSGARQCPQKIKSHLIERLAGHDIVKSTKCDGGFEQRIGRIHRYGQKDTAQVYNLILSDTIEGRIFLLLDEKLTEIARTVGKVDDQGNVAEDLRAQI